MIQMLMVIWGKKIQAVKRLRITKEETEIQEKTLITKKLNY